MRPYDSVALLVVLLISLPDGHLAIECGSNEVKVQKPHVPPESNGCSKPEFIQVAGEEDFTYCCDRHDACYGMCGSDKQYCDKDFGRCNKAMCKSVFPRNNQCTSAADTYAMGTMMFGVEGWNGSQEQHCVCIPNTPPPPPADGVELTAEEAHYVALVDDFYAKYGAAKEGRKPSQELVLSYTRTKKLPLYRLYYDLHKKYDAAIKHIDGRVGRKPPRMPEKKAPTVEAEAEKKKEL